MRFAPRRLPAALPAAVAATLVLLGLLGVLQYRWAGELSEGFRTRLRAGAQSRADALAGDFDLEITRAFTGLAISPDLLPAGRDADYAVQYERWRTGAAHPELVRAVYVARAEAGSLRLRRYQPAARAFAPEPWPRGLEGVRARLEDVASSTGAALDPGWRRALGPIVEEVPALIAFPFAVSGARRSVGSGGAAGLAARRAAAGVRDGGFLPARPDTFTVVVLDREAIVGRMLPELAERHFTGVQDLDYDLDVVRQQDPDHVVWRSREGAAPRRDHDAVAALLSLRFEDEEHPEGPPPGMPVVRAGGPRGDRAAHWRLRVAHRAGPLDQVVAAVRRRNLAVGLGVLLLLGVSVGLVVASSHRARRTAERQMEFVAAVSHELRTPVAVIRSTSENLADGVAREPAQVLEYGAVIRDQAVRLGAMIERVLEFAGTAGRRSPLPDHEVDVSHLVQESLDAFTAALRERAFTVLAQLEPGLAVRGDAITLRRAVDNLVENALNHGGEGRWLRVRAARAGHGGAIHVAVEDHGEGIVPSDLSRVFEPFFRGTGARGRGFGLGLALVRRVVEDHGGRLAVHSEPGRGTTFTIELPAAPVRAAAAGEAGHALAHPRR